MNERSRAHVSESLPAFVRDELDADGRSLVEGHLESCPDCRAELAGVKALLAVEEVRLDDLERSRLHAAVSEGLDPTEAPRDDSLGVWLPPRKSVWSRFAPSLGAAALVLIAVIAGVTVGGGDDDSGEGGTAVELEEGAGGADREGGGEREAPKDKAKSGAAPAAEGGHVDDQLDSTTESGSDRFAFQGARPRFSHVRGLAKDGGESTLAEVVSNQYWSKYAAGYTTRDAKEGEDFAIMALQERAPKDLRGRVRGCARRVLDSHEEPLLAAYGSLGEIESTRTLLLGFVYSERSKGPLDSYLVRSWSGPCTGSFRHFQGSIDD